jgi:hypothetical protein
MEVASHVLEGRCYCGAIGFHLPHVASVCPMDCASVSMQLLPRTWCAHRFGSKGFGDLSIHRTFQIKALSGLLLPLGRSEGF